MASFYYFNVSSSFKENYTSPDEFSDSWKVVTVVSKVLLVLSCYLVATLVLFEFRVNLKNRKEGRRRNMTLLCVDNTANMMRWLCLAAAGLYFLQFIFELIEIHESHISNSLCDKIRHIKTILQCGAITCLYLVLWFRQRTFYRMPVFMHLCGKMIRFLSWAVVVIMALANVITVTLYLSTRKYHRSQRGCILHQWTIWRKLPGLLLLIFSTSFQVILVGLLIYPLLKHGATVSLPGTGKQMKQVKRVFFSALFALSTTVIISILTMTVFERTHGSVGQIAQGFNIFVIFLSILFSFNDWKSRLFALFVKNDQIVSTVKMRMLRINTKSEELSIET